MSLLEVRNLGVQFRVENRLVEAVQDLSFNIDRGETVALVGESGSGKSVTALSILQLLPYPRARHPHGSIQFNNMEMLGASKPQLHEVRGNKISMIFQEPMTSLNPLHTIEKQITVSADEVFDVGRYTLHYTGMREHDNSHISSQIATVQVLVNDRQIGTMHPEKRFYKKQEQPTTEVDIRATLVEDLYLVFGAYDAASGLATFQIFINPLVSWIWIGGLTLILGTCVIMVPSLAERQAFALARGAAGIRGEQIAD